MKKKALVICILAACSGTALADDAAKPAVPTLSDVLDASGIAMTGYIDFAYNHMNSTGLQQGGIPSRIFDTPGALAGQNFNSFNLQQAAVFISKTPKEGLGGLVNITSGQDAPGVAANGLGLGNPNHFTDLTQAYASYATGPTTVIAGKYTTLAGAEYIASPMNKNYSRAWMFGWGPYTHTGVRTTYVADDVVTLIGGINNGWDQVAPIQGAPGKTAELGLVLTPSPMFSLATTYLNGKEGSLTSPLANTLPGQSTSVGTIGTRSYLDMVGTINATDKLNFVFDYANGSQSNVTLTGLAAPIDAKWDALALYANYQFTDVWRLSYRHETFNDKNGFRSGLLINGVATGQKLDSNTLTVGYALDKKWELRGEVRYDHSTQNAFLMSNNTAANSQHSFAVQALYQF
jgi:hypothetical protein